MTQAAESCNQVAVSPSRVQNGQEEALGAALRGDASPGLAPSPGDKWASQVFARRDLAQRSQEVRLIGTSRPPVGVSRRGGWAGGPDTPFWVGVSCWLGLLEEFRKPPQRPTLVSRQVPGAGWICESLTSCSGPGHPVCLPQHRFRQVGARELVGGPKFMARPWAVGSDSWFNLPVGASGRTTGRRPRERFSVLPK